ncbi:MAG: immunoglobulin domain-containing protein [Puniceicoccaceae bacterium]
MNERNNWTKFGLILAGAFLLLLGIILVSPDWQTSSVREIHSKATIEEADEQGPKAAFNEEVNPVPAAPEAPSFVGWVNNDGRLTRETEQLLSWIEAGYPVDVRVGQQRARRMGFRPLNVTTENFRISAGKETELPADFHVFTGRETGLSGIADQASLAIVNGAVSMALTLDGDNYLIETDPETGELYATSLQPFDSGHSCSTNGCQGHDIQCELTADGRLAAARVPLGAGSFSRERIPVSLVFPGDRIDTASLIEAAEEPEFEAGTGNKPILRNGSQYDASLKDIIILMVSAKSQSGPASGLSTKAANYFAYAARAADVYERQLGFRYLLQEMILIPSDSSEEDPGNPDSDALGQDLYKLNTWVGNYRPQSTYKWGHVALWTLVAGGGGGTIGLAWTDCYGLSSYGHSVAEPNWGWEVHCHELGHNVGSTHTAGGVMNPSIRMGNEDFFTMIEGGSYTAAKDIYNYMGSPGKAYVLGDALLRHPEEIPFGVDDSASTAAGTAVTINPLSNDLTKVNGGSSNTLRLVEVGQVLPKAAGTAAVAGNTIEFIPASGFTGQAWFTYTLGGNVGNGGQGWLHRADIVVTVGGDSTAPSDTPVLSLSNDSILSELNGPVRINPLLNDEGSGRLWSGDVEVVLSPTDTTPEAYSQGALHLVDATVVTGTGTISLEKRNMTRSSSGSSDNSGYLTYTPGQNEGGQVVIEYTVSDSLGNTGTASIVIAEAAAVGVVASTNSVTEDSGEVVVLTFERSGAADTSGEEWIDFTVDGTASATGIPADYALAGHSSFDPLTGAGSIVIPVGATQASMYVAIDNDGISEGQESFGLNITGTSLLMVGSNDSVQVFISDNSLVYAESFDTFTADPATWNGWSNAKNKRANGKGGEDWFDWASDSYSTPTAGTGPDGDHTHGSGKYLFADATGNAEVYAILQSPVIPVGGVSSANLEFWYHMYGSGMGALTVDLYVNGSLAAAGAFSATGQQSVDGSDWKKAVIDLNPYLPATSIQLEMRADTTTSELGDIAIDDMQVVGQSNAVPQAPSIWVDPSGCTVEEGDSVYLSVIAEGFPAPSIQWIKDGNPIPGATGASYYIASVASSSAGTYQALVSNVEGSVYSFEANIDLPPPPGDIPGEEYFGWAGSYALGPEDSGQSADPDLDGILNLFEFAFNFDPTVAGEHPKLPRAMFHEENGSVYLQIEYRQRTGGTWDNVELSYAVDDITYVVETSSSLSGTWDSGAAHLEVVGTPVDNLDGTETILVRRSTPITGPAFIRLSITADF